MVLETTEAPPPGTLGEDERRRRSELAVALRPSCFPARREQLIVVARDEVAPTWVIELLEALPIDTRFDTVQDIWDVVGGRREERDAIPPEHEPDSASEQEVPGTGMPSAIPVATEAVGRQLSTSLQATPALVVVVQVGLGIAAVGIGLGISATRAAVSLGRRVIRWTVGAET